MSLLQRKHYEHSSSNQILELKVTVYFKVQLNSLVPALRLRHTVTQVPERQ